VRALKVTLAGLAIIGVWSFAIHQLRPGLLPTQQAPHPQPPAVLTAQALKSLPAPRSQPNADSAVQPALHASESGGQNPLRPAHVVTASTPLEPLTAALVATTVANSAATTASTTQTATTARIVSIEDTAQQWSWSPSQQPTIWLASEHCVLVIESAQVPDTVSSPPNLLTVGAPVGSAPTFRVPIELKSQQVTIALALNAANTPQIQSVPQTRPGAITLRRPDATAPLAPPQRIQAYAGTHYPGSTAPLPQFIGEDSQIGTDIRIDRSTNELLVVQLGMKGGNLRPVLSVSKDTVTGTQGSERVVTRIDSRLPEVNALGFIAVRSSGPNTNHSLSVPASEVELHTRANVQFGTISLIPNNTQVQGKAAVNGRFYATGAAPGSVTVRLNLPTTFSSHASHAVRLFDGATAVSEPQTLSAADIAFRQVQLREGLNQLQLQVYAAEREIGSVALPPIEVQTGGFRIIDVGPSDFGQRLGVQALRIRFSRPPATMPLQGAVSLYFSATGDLATASQVNGPSISQDPTDPSVVSIAPAKVEAGVYLLQLDSSQIVDHFGNRLEGSDGVVGRQYQARLGSMASAVAPSSYVTPGVTRGQAPFVAYPPYVEQAHHSKGFNPNDKVETRVARLYFYRDAHRVAQILNRRVQSYNRHDVAMHRQFADKARQEAESLTTSRQQAERYAVDQAQRTRQLENQLSDAQRALNFSLQQMQVQALQSPPAVGTPEFTQRQAAIAQLETAARGFSNQVQQLEKDVKSARDSEVNANERWQMSQRSEELARGEQFRWETAAAHADPDTFAAGEPGNIDPVAQVSISVIGEGLIHLRGPLRGVNQVRIMIDQIDTPSGQVRINIHSTQINGDEADKLEVVANRIQTYIDQARFLTMQSGEMLRKAVVHVAATKAEEARGFYPGDSQADRDQRYLIAFFGRDFVQELRTLDSELLHTGNKLLSLHSMDVTSLSSALMLLALANNSTRLAIVQEFERLVQTELSVAEQQFIQNSLQCCPGGCKPGCKRHQRHHAPPPICYLSRNATFTSLRGFFDAQLTHDDTVSPLQREMLRLAQILKARLVTEMEFKQRVMERALIEERIDDSPVNQQAVREREKQAEEELRRAMKELGQTQSQLSTRIAQGVARVTAMRSANVAYIKQNDLAFSQALNELLNGKAVISRQEVDLALTLQDLEQDIQRWRSESTDGKRQNSWSADRTMQRLVPQLMPSGNGTHEMWNLVKAGEVPIPGLIESARLLPTFRSIPESELPDVVALTTESSRASLRHGMIEIMHREWEIGNHLRKFGLLGVEGKPLHDALSLAIEDTKKLASIPNQPNLQPVIRLASLRILSSFVALRKQRTAELDTNLEALRIERQKLVSRFAELSSQIGQHADGMQRASGFYEDWLAWSRTVQNYFQWAEDESVKREIREALDPISTGIENWILMAAQADLARRNASDYRRPLDHKKFLDMLIDDLEEKYIELLEGTRAHTANIDNYLKRLTTALDDDFNTQFYYPVFRSVREASQAYKVEFGQTETTSILANNRELGKVSPTATMEFDLPKRDILIKEGIDSALAVYNDVGALVNDPNLLALAKLQSGQSAASPPAGTLGGYSAVRNVVPGLSTDVSGRLIAQNAGSGPTFESNVEKLIPDPAIYKFETGTGYEIRPVIAPDGQAVVFHFNYMYTTQVREPVRADEKHLGRIKQHYIDTDVQLSNFELREVSRYVVALKAARTAKGVPLLEDLPVVGALWRPLPSDEKSLQQNIILAQATVFPTLFDLMGLRWAPAISDLDPLRLSNREYLVRSRQHFLENRIYDFSSSRVDDFLRIPEESRRADLYRSQSTIPAVHPNGYRGPGLDLETSTLREGYSPEQNYVPPAFIPSASPEGALYLPHLQREAYHDFPPAAERVVPSGPITIAPQLLPTPLP
jgi:hypothetical protein